MHTLDLYRDQSVEYMFEIWRDLNFFYLPESDPNEELYSKGSKKV